MSTIHTINLGNYANDGTGDDLRTAFEKVNNNFAALNSEVTIAGAENVGQGVGIFATRSAATLDFKSLISRDNSVVIAGDDTTISLQTITKLQNDITPKLGGNMILNGFSIQAPNGGNIESNIFNLDVQIINSLLMTMITSSINQLMSIDFGSYTTPTGQSLQNPRGFNVDLNGSIIDAFQQVPSAQDIDLGDFTFYI